MNYLKGFNSPLKKSTFLSVQEQEFMRTYYKKKEQLPAKRSSLSSSSTTSAGFGPLEFVLRSSAGRLAGSGDEGLDCLKKKLNN